MLAAPGLLLVLGASLLTGSWVCWGTERGQVFMALKMSSTQLCSVGGREVALVAPGVFVWLWWRKAGVTVVCGSVERCQLVLSSLGTVTGHCSSLSSSLGPASCSCRSCLSLQEKSMFSQPPCHGTSSVGHSDRHTKGRTGLRGQQGFSGDPGDGGCPPVMPQGSC